MAGGHDPRPCPSGYSPEDSREISRNEETSGAVPGAGRFCVRHRTSSVRGDKLRGAAIRAAR
jgi:hypothetical protein